MPLLLLLLLCVFPPEIKIKVFLLFLVNIKFTQYKIQKIQIALVKSWFTPLLCLPATYFLYFETSTLLVSEVPIQK